MYREYDTIVGVDEAGRGPLAGPVCAAACILPRNAFETAFLAGLNDSKKMTPKRREEVFAIIDDTAEYGVAYSGVEVIDDINILAATMLCMSKAVRGIAEQLEGKKTLILFDGNKVPEFEVGTLPYGVTLRSLVHGDGTSAAVAAASVIAKVIRDRYMLSLHESYPQYGFDVHKGYGTKMHFQRLAEFGMCPEHRRTFLKKL